MLSCTSAGKAHGQTQTLSYDRPLQKYIVPEISNFARYDLIRKFLDPLVNRPFCMIGHTGYLTENPVPDLLDTCFDTSHCTLSF